MHLSGKMYHDRSRYSMLKHIGIGKEGVKHNCTSIANNQQRNKEPEKQSKIVYYFNYRGVADLKKAKIYPSIDEEEFLHLHDDTRSTELPSSTAFF